LEKKFYPSFKGHTHVTFLHVHAVTHQKRDISFDAVHKWRSDIPSKNVNLKLNEHLKDIRLNVKTTVRVGVGILTKISYHNLLRNNHDT